MHLRERLQSGAGPSLSFEFFPPKNEQAAAALYQTIRELEPYHPSFVSVTYGAGGSTRELTREVVLRIQHESRIPTVPHLTCVGHSREEVWSILDQYASSQCAELLDSGVAGIHFYTLNQSRATRQIYRNLGLKDSLQLLEHGEDK